MFEDHHFQIPVRTPKDVLCLGCKLKFTISADEFDTQVKKGAIEEHKFTVQNYSNSLAKYTCHDCPHCRRVGDAKPRPTVDQQMATIRIRRMELESLGQDRAEATSTAVAEQMAASDDEYYR
jgi:Ribonuclease G/E